MAAATIEGGASFPRLYKKGKDTSRRHTPLSAGASHLASRIKIDAQKCLVSLVRLDDRLDCRDVERDERSE